MRLLSKQLQLVCALSFFFSVSVAAQMPLSAYENLKNQPGADKDINEYLVGVYKGALLFDAYAHRYLDKPSETFCTDSVVWSGDYPRRLLDKQIADQKSTSKPYPDDIPVELIMFHAMTQHLKCE